MTLDLSKCLLSFLLLMYDALNVASSLFELVLILTGVLAFSVHVLQTYMGGHRY